MEIAGCCLRVCVSCDFVWYKAKVLRPRFTQSIRTGVRNSLYQRQLGIGEVSMDFSGGVRGSGLIKPIFQIGDGL